MPLGVALRCACTQKISRKLNTARGDCQYNIVGPGDQHVLLYLCLATVLVQQALRVKWHVFGVFVCFDLYFVNYRSWQAEILQERAEGCIQVDLQKKIRQD